MIIHINTAGWIQNPGRLQGYSSASGKHKWLKVRQRDTKKATIIIVGTTQSLILPTGTLREQYRRKRIAWWGGGVNIGINKWDKNSDLSENESERERERDK